MANKEATATAKAKDKPPGPANGGQFAEICVGMTQDKVTKNSVRYKEDHDSDTEPDRIGQLYLQKHNFPNGAPERIMVTVEPAE